MANEYERERLVEMAEKLVARAERRLYGAIIAGFCGGGVLGMFGGVVLGLLDKLDPRSSEQNEILFMMLGLLFGGILGTVAKLRWDQRRIATAQSWLALASIEESNRRIADALEAQNNAGPPSAEK